MTREKPEAVNTEHLLECARFLSSEDGENPEYDRALVELCIDAVGWPMGHEEKAEMAALLGIRGLQGEDWQKWLGKAGQG